MVLLSSLLLIVACGKLSFGALPTNGNATDTVGWQSDPNGRGTFTLVSSCVFTLIICVYSAMHLNVPPHGESGLQFWWRNIRWALAGIFGPELVVFIAWKQYLSARAIVKRSQNELHLNGVSPLGEKAEKQVNMEIIERPALYSDLPSPWTVVHGFYAGMGGFTFPLSSFSANQTTPMLKSDCKRLTLTARGVALLADCDLLPDIERKLLDDKSKSDGLSKFIACVQAAWLIVQVIGRLKMGLQVTLLEINTLGHVLCALVIYVLWWHKPRMVLEPIALHGDWVGPLCAYMYISSRVSGQKVDAAGVFEESSTEPETSWLAFFPGKPCNRCAETAQECSSTTAHRSSNNGQGFRPIPIAAAGSRALSDASKGTTVTETTGGSFGLRPALLDSTKDTHDLRSTQYHDEKEDLGAGRRLRWCLAAEAVRKYPAIKRRFESIKHRDAEGKTITYLQEREPEELVEEHCSNWSTKGLLPGDYGLVMGMCLWFASMAFGGIHAAAWYDYFPSEVESWLWRISAIYITWSGLVWLLINLVAQMCKPFDDYWNRTRLPYAPFANSIPLVVVCFICGTLYTFARMYLVVEAFVSIRQLPASAYQTPEWTQIIPHL